jgi:Pyruvate/2-oxoacid:ferredoxin oxidoreductase delta subunit
MNNPEKQSTLGTRQGRRKTKEKQNQEWTIQRNNQHSSLLSCAQCWLFLWIVHSWFCFSLVFLRSCLVPNVDSKENQNQEWTIQRHNQHWAQDKNEEKQMKHKIKNEQSRDTINIGHKTSLILFFFCFSSSLSCAQCWLFLWIVHSWFCFSLVFLRSCLVPNVKNEEKLKKNKIKKEQSRDKINIGHKTRTKKN